TPDGLAYRGTEPLPADASAYGAADAYPTPHELPASEPAPLAAQPTMIYREPDGPTGRLVVVSGNDRGREYAMALAEITIGRGAENDVVLADIAISRRHVTIFRDGPGFGVRDLHSGNGTFVNGRRIEQCPLNDGDQIEVGNSVMRFVVAGAAGPDYAAPPRPQRTPAPMPPPGRPLAPTALRSSARVIAAADPEPFSVPPDPLPDYAAAAPAPAPGYPPGYAPVAAAPVRAPGGLGKLTATRQGKLLTFGVLGLLLMLVGSAFVKKVVLKGRRAGVVAVAPASQQLPPEEQYGEGVKKFREGDWEGAKQAFERVLAQVPDFQGAKKYSERCDVEMKSQELLATAKKALDAKDFSAAKAALREIDGASKPADEATKLLKSLPARQLETLLAAAKKARDEEDFTTAKAKVEEALAVQPDHAEALALRTELEKAKPKTDKEKARAEREREKAEKKAAEAERKAKAAEERKGKAEERKTAVAKLSPKERAAEERKAKSEAQAEKKRAERDEKDRKAKEAKADKARKAEEERQRKLAAKAEKGKKPGPEPEEKGPAPTGPVNDKVAMNHYRAREWGMAISTLKAMADKQKGKAQSKTLAMAEDIRKMGQAFNRAEAAAGSNAVAAIRSYEQAAAIDRRIGKGAHAGYISQKLAKLTRAEAQRALSSGKYELAWELVRTAQRHGGDDAQTRAVSVALEGKAKELFERGYQIKGQKPDEAKALWRRVLKMVPSSSGWYGKAYKYLNEASGSRQRDEDE
ncbi:MAG TPA: FHA domain-containing protein, partial [Polyangia bacterium]